MMDFAESWKQIKVKSDHDDDIRCLEWTEQLLLDQPSETPTSCASVCQCRGCGRLPRRIRPAYQRDTPIWEAIAEFEIAASWG